jgi:hypothetical protein
MVVSNEETTITKEPTANGRLMDCRCAVEITAMEEKKKQEEKCAGGKTSRTTKEEPRKQTNHSRFRVRIFLLAHLFTHICA